MIEFIFKLVTTIIFVFILYWLWTHQIDMKDTFLSPIKKIIEKPIDWIETRDSNAIYQNDKIVGNITGAVTEVDNKLIFTEICNTSALNRSMPFEYRREKLKVIKIGPTIGQYSSVTNNSTVVKQSVIKDVVCERIK